MIHVCTVHWKTDRWIDPQLACLQRFVSAPYRLYSFFTGIPTTHRDRFFYARETEFWLHEAKLNILADIAWFNRETDDDWLVFLDGDAFPVAELTAWGEERLKRYPLLAVRRDENLGDIQPHPSFCLTTLRFWRELDGDWSKGFEWRIRDGRKRTDVGARLYEQLRDGGHDWYPLLRSNRADLHPLYFGIYDDVVYHHGAGFRRLFSTIDADYLSWPEWLYDRLVFPRLHPRIRHYIPHGSGIAKKNARVAEKVLERMDRDPDFFRLFQQAGSREKLAAAFDVDVRDLLDPGTARTLGGRGPANGTRHVDM